MAKYKIKKIFIYIVCFLFFVPFSTKADVNSGLVGYWKFDEGSGDRAYDFSGNGNTVELIGNHTWTSGQRGGAISFNGISDYIRVRENDTLRSGPKTIVVWANLSDFLKLYAGVFSWSGPGCTDSYYGYARYSGNFGVYYENSSDGITRQVYPAGNSAVLWKLGEWAQYAIVYDGEDVVGGRVNINIYKNGVLQGVGYVGADGLSADCAMRVIGSQEDYPNPQYIRTFSGMIDDYRVYNRPLSADEIQILYNEYRIATSDFTSPTTPGNLSATAVSSSRIEISWNSSGDNIGVAGYIIYRNGSPIATVRSGTAYVDVAHNPNTIYYYTLNPSTTYTYSVAAFDAAYNVSSQSSPVSVTTPAILASGPFELSVTVSGSGANPSPNVQSYPSGFSCASGTCSSSFPGGTYVNLLPYPFITGWRDLTFNFTGWSGSGCSGNGGCTILMDSNKSVAAYYGIAPPPNYQCSDGIDNDSDGLADYPADPGCSSFSDNDESDSANDAIPPGPPGNLYVQ